MNGHSCCKTEKAGREYCECCSARAGPVNTLSLAENQTCCVGRAKTFGRRFCTAAEWLIPSAFLVLMPKCPLCIVTYVAMIFGISLSVTAASSIRVAAIVVCVVALLFLAVGPMLRRHCRLDF